MALNLVIYIRPDCHLCEEMKAVVLLLAQEFGAALEEIDIDSDPDLVVRFGQEIPVLFINERKAFKYRVSEAELRRRLQRAARAIR